MKPREIIFLAQHRFNPLYLSPHSHVHLVGVASRGKPHEVSFYCLCILLHEALVIDEHMCRFSKLSQVTDGWLMLQ